MLKVNGLSRYWVDVLLGFMAVTILLVDFNIPLGVSVEILYVAVMVIAAISRSASRVLFWAGLCSFLTVVGYYISPLGSEMFKVIANRMLALFAIWSVVWLYFYFERNKERLGQAQQDIGTVDELSHIGLVAKYTTDVVIITDKDGLITWVNKSFVDISGYTLEEVQGQKPSKFLQGNETSLSEVRKISEALKRGEHVKSELINYHKDGSKYWIDMAISPILKNGHVDQFIAVERDITYRKELEKSIQAQDWLAEQENARKIHLLSVFKRQVGEVFKLSEVNGTMHRDGNAVRYLEAMDHFIDLTLYPEEFDHTPIDVGIRLVGLIDELTCLARAKGYRLSHSIHGDISGYKVCESTIQHQRLLMFLLVTLEVTTEDRALELHITCVPHRDELHFDIELNVPDSGVLARYVDMLQAKRTDSSRLESLPEVMSSILSKIDPGFGYSVLIVDNSSRISLTADMPIREFCRQEPCSDKVLIAEDNKVNVLVLSKIMKGLGYDKIDVAEDGAKAVEMAIQGEYSIILMDNHMPELTGIEATRVILKERSIPVNIVACTADTGLDVKEAFLNNGAKEVLLKPIKKEKLKAALDQLSVAKRKAG